MARSIYNSRNLFRLIDIEVVLARAGSTIVEIYSV